MIIINNIDFNNTKELRKYIDQEIKNKYKDNSKINEEHQIFIKDLLRFQYQDSFVTNITSINVISEMIYKKRQKLLLAHINKFEDQYLNISSCIEQASFYFYKQTKGYTKNKDWYVEVYHRDLRRKRQNLLRKLVYNQTNQFRINYERQYPNYDFSNYQVHHVKPEFQEIVDNWLESKGINLEDLEIYQKRLGVFKLSNQELAKDFQQYHKKVAVLDYIPKEENLKKQKKSNLSCFYKL